MRETPKVSVLMSVYNGRRYLSQAINSILAQTHKNLEFIIVNDGSSDNSKEIVELFQGKDNRIILIDNQKNLGLTESLNKGIAIAKGEYIARMDADDISHPERLEKQIDYLESHKDVGILGTNGYFIDQNNRIFRSLKNPADDLEIRWGMLFNNQFIHCSIMFCRHLYFTAGGYSREYRYSQDYEFCSRLINYSRAANLKEMLVSWRKSSNNISSLHNKEQRELSVQISMANINRLFAHKFVVNKREIVSFRKMHKGAYFNDEETHIKKYLIIIDQFIKQRKITPSKKRKLSKFIYSKLFESVFRKGIKKNNFKYLYLISKRSPFAMPVAIKNMIIIVLRKSSLLIKQLSEPKSR